MNAGEREMPAKEKDNVPSVTGFIVFVAAAALAALADVSALVLVSTELRAADGRATQPGRADGEPSAEESAESGETT